jgi:hypothetical protein
MWSLITSNEPHSELNEFQIITGVLTENLRPEIPLSCIPEYADLMKRCWVNSLKIEYPHNFRTKIQKNDQVLMVF